MAQFRKAVITQKGLALIQKTQMQNVKLEFSKIAAGSGEYKEDEVLDGVTALKQQVQEFPFSSVAVVDPQTIKLVSVISNKELQSAYYIREIGVYATDPDEGDILYSIAVAYPGKADYMPAYDGLAPVTIGLDTFQAVSNSENVTIRADTGAYATAEDLKNLTERFESFVQNNPRVMFGSAATEIDSNTVLFITDEAQVQGEFAGASYTNLYMGTDPPQAGDNWAKTDGKTIISGKLAVSEKEPTDAAFFAKINQI